MLNIGFLALLQPKHDHPSLNQSVAASSGKLPRPVIPTEAQRSGEIISDHFTSFKDFSASLEMTMDLDHYVEHWFLACPSAKARPSFTQSKPCCFIWRAPTARHLDRSAA